MTMLPWRQDRPGSKETAKVVRAIGPAKFPLTRANVVPLTTGSGPYGTAFKPSRTPANRCDTRVPESAADPESAFRGGLRGHRGSGAGRCGGYGTAFKPCSTAGATPVAQLPGRHPRGPIRGRPVAPRTRGGTWRPSPDRRRAPRAASGTTAGEPGGREAKLGLGLPEALSQGLKVRARTGTRRYAPAASTLRRHTHADMAHLVPVDGRDSVS